MTDSRESLLAALAWQAELGADEAIGDDFVDRTLAVEPETPKAASKPAPSSAPVLALTPPGEGETEAIAATCTDLPALHAAIEAYGHPLKSGARTCVFADGNPAARVMIVGEAPGRNEDIEGRPFVGIGGQLLDRMLAAIGLSRHDEDPEKAVYITNIVPWRPAQNRTPTPVESDAFLPFVRRHIDLIDPALIVAMGNTPTKALLGTKTGIMRMRGIWTEAKTPAATRPCLPMLHPAYLLRQPMDKHKAWSDLLTLQARIETSK